MNATKLSHREMEMIRMLGLVPEDAINGLKEDMRGFIEASWQSIKKLENTYPAPFDHHGYKERHNHIELEGSMTQASKDGFYGTTLIVSDIKNLEKEEVKHIPISELAPPVLLNDLVVRTSDKLDDGRKKRYYEIHKYDPETDLFYYSQYEFRFASKRTVESKPLPQTVISQNATKSNEETIPAHIELLQSAVFPLRWVTVMLITGMWGQWKDMSFNDYPVLFTWYEDVPYKLYRDFAKENFTNGEEHSILADILEASIGFQRYLIKLTEDREKVSIKKEKKASAAPSKAIREDNSTASQISATDSVKHVITLDKSIVVYTTQKDAVKSFRHPQKCMYRYSVRGHYRHYKNGRVVWISPFDKNKDKPFNSHTYGA